MKLSELLGYGFFCATIGLVVGTISDSVITSLMIGVVYLLVGIAFVVTGGNN